MVVILLSSPYNSLFFKYISISVLISFADHLFLFSLIPVRRGKSATKNKRREYVTTTKILSDGKLHLLLMFNTSILGNNISSFT
jgi:hypothetical protein